MRGEINKKMGRLENISNNTKAIKSAMNGAGISSLFVVGGELINSNSLMAIGIGTLTADVLFVGYYFVKEKIEGYKQKYIRQERK